MNYDYVMSSDLWKGQVLQWVASDCNMEQIIQLWNKLFLEDSSEEDFPGTGFHREQRKEVHPGTS